VGLLQAVLGLSLGLASIESLGLVSGDDASVNWALALPGAAVLAAIGLSVGFTAGRASWIRVGLGAAALAGLLGIAAGLVVGSVLAGGLVFVVCQLAPALLPADRPVESDPSTT